MPTVQTRKLSAILFADIVGYTALMQTNEQQALAALQKFKTALETQVPTHQGEIIQFYGDGCLCVFNSSVDAVNCAKHLQTAFQSEPRVPVRIGLHAGDVVFRDDNVFGDAVNIASRVESIGIPGAVLLSSNVRNQIKNKPEFELVSLGRFEFKNVKEGMTVYALGNEGFVVPEREEMKGKVKSKVYSPISKGFWKSLLIFTVVLFGVALLSPSFFKEKTTIEAKHISKEKPSIALLQFEDGSPDRSLAYLGFGLKEELLTSLIKLQKLDIISTSQIKNAQKNLEDPQLIGEQLKADYVLAGSVRANENTIRFNVRLLDVANNSFVWAYNEESARNELLQLQQSFAEGIAKNLPIKVSRKDLAEIRKAEVDPRAYELYLKGAYYANYLPETAKKNNNYLLEAITIDPDFALPYINLAINEWMMAENGKEPPIPHWIKAQKYIDKAISLDSLNVNAWGNKGVIQHCYEWDYEGVELSFKTAESINPNAVRHYAVFLSCNGRKEELFERINRLKANNSIKEDEQGLFKLIAWLYLNNSKWDAAVDILKQLEKVHKNINEDWLFNQL